MRPKLFDTHDVAAQIDVIRRGLRTVLQKTGPVPLELAADHDMDWEVQEFDRLTREAEEAEQAAAHAKILADRAARHVDDVTKPPEQKAAELARERADAVAKAAEGRVAVAKAAREAAAAQAKNAADRVSASRAALATARDEAAARNPIKSAADASAEIKAS